MGSGQFGTPWERMHRANVRMSLHDCCSSAWVGWLPGPFGSRCMQALWADWNWELLTPSCCRLTLGIAPLLSGSGKFGTPLERMHVANASDDERPAPGAVEPELAAPLVVSVLLPALLDVVVPRPATNGDFEPPHPEASNERPARAPKNNEQRALEPDIRPKAKRASLKRL